MGGASIKYYDCKLKLSVNDAKIWGFAYSSNDNGEMVMVQATV
jgi:hypothetical protein